MTPATALACQTCMSEMAAFCSDCERVSSKATNIKARDTAIRNAARKEMAEEYLNLIKILPKGETVSILIIEKLVRESLRQQSTISASTSEKEDCVNCGDKTCMWQGEQYRKTGIKYKCWKQQSTEARK